jgi:xanthine/CO dehydrogenase XdhC/CoxF family maturation factor
MYFFRFVQMGMLCFTVLNTNLQPNCNMKEIRAIIEAYNSANPGVKAALATVVRVEGSSYRRTGARMLVWEDGNYLGGISGGCLEGDALRRAQKAIAMHKPSVITYDTTQDDASQIGVGLGCNGIIDVLFTPLHKEDANNPIALLASVVNTRTPRCMVTIMATPTDEQTCLGKAWLYTDDAAFKQIFPFATVVDELLTTIHLALDNKQSQVYAATGRYAALKIFIEIIEPVVQLFIFGAQYDVLPLVQFAAALGWQTNVVANPAKIGKAVFGAATAVLHPDGINNLPIDGYSAMVLMAHDYKTDLRHLQFALTTQANYIGLLGPKKRSNKMFDELGATMVVTEKDHQRIYAPAGLDIGANNPEEIALSIVAEIRSCFAGRKGMSLKLREGSIYSN